MVIHGDKVVRVLGGGCGEPVISLQGYQGLTERIQQAQPSSVSSLLAPPTYGWGGHEFSVGGYFGAIGRTDTYDDDYKVGGTSFLLGGSVNLTVPLTPRIFVGGGLEIMYPFQSAELEDTRTKLGITGIYQGILGTNFHIEDHPIRLWGQFGGAIGAVQSGYDGLTSYNDTEALKGWTVGAGASMPVCPHGSITTSFSYTDFPSSSFSAPSSTYDMSDSGYSGTVGYRFTFGGHKW
jgi:opacity protein-like surface antigen